MPPVSTWVSPRRVTRLRTTSRRHGPSYWQASAQACCSSRVWASRSSTSSASGMPRYDGTQVSVKSSRSPSCTSKVSSWVPSWAVGSLGPVRMSLSGPAVAMMAGWPATSSRCTHGPDPAVVEADHPAVLDRDGPAHALHPAYDVGAALAGGHQVGHPDLAGLRAVRRLEDGGVADVAALGGVLTDGPEEPVAVVVVAQQPGEAGRGVELRQAQPVQGAVDADQCHGVAVADGGVVLDRQRHAGRLVPGALSRH